MSLSFTLLPALALLLSWTVGIQTTTVLVSLILFDGYGLLPLLKRTNSSALIDMFRSLPRRLGHVLGQPIAILAVVGIALTLYNWIGAIGIYSIDLGVHVYWAKVIITTQHLPNYFVVEPLDQAVKFTFGSHAMLAEFFMINGAPIESFSWIPEVIAASGISLGSALFTWRATKSIASSILAATLIGVAYHPGGYIQRGNLPDIIGYLLILTSLYSLLKIDMHETNFRYAFGLASISVIPFHQLATVILPVVLLFGLAAMLVFSRTELNQILGGLFPTNRKILFWLGILILATTYMASVTYVRRDTLTQLATSGWQPWVQPLSQYPIVIGAGLFYLGLLGLAVCFRYRTPAHMLLIAWIAALLLLANALLIGLPVLDPQRFVWRMTEPLSIGGGIIISEAFKRMPVLYRTLSKQGPSIMSARGGIMLGVIILPMLFLAVQVTNSVSVSQPYRFSQEFFSDDVRIGQWLRGNASSDSIIVNDADIDTTATWVQTYSMDTHFIYKVSFGSVAAPQGYIQIYRDAEKLYKQPNSTSAYQILTKYPIGYLVAHGSEIRLFESSPYFKEVFRTGNSALFETG